MWKPFPAESAKRKRIVIIVIKVGTQIALILGAF
jgi:hypothetical protein